MRLVWFLVLSLGMMGAGVWADDRPNFVLLIADDISYDDLGCYGSADARTPHIDALAREGMRFTNAFLTASSCSPSRSSIITGRYPHNNGEASELHRSIPWHLPAFTGVLREAGYHTALAGKDHMSWQSAPEGETAVADAFEVRYAPKVPGNSGGHGNWIKAIDECPEGKPFFLWLAALDAHRDWDADAEWDEAAYGPMYRPELLTLPPAFVDTPDTRQDFASYLNEVTRFDYFVGQVVAHLKKTGQFEKTYLFVLADNGRPFPRAKTRLHDDGMKTYFVVSGPAIQDRGSVCRNLLSVIDLAPTVTELAGVMPRPETFQGRSFLPMLKDPAASIRPYAFSEHNWHDYEAHGRAVRDGRWLYIVNARPQLAWQGPADSAKSPTFQDLRQAAASTAPLTPIQADVFLAPRPERELYDTMADPHQISNLAGDERFQDHEARLSKVLAHWAELTGDSVPDELSGDFFDRQTGEKIRGMKREDYQKAPAGADRNAERIHAEGL
jgi:N-sulfoglucosamine sulfohydrolase